MSFNFHHFTEIFFFRGKKRSKIENYDSYENETAVALYCNLVKTQWWREIGIGGTAFAHAQSMSSFVRVYLVRLLLVKDTFYLQSFAYFSRRFNFRMECCTLYQCIFSRLNVERPVLLLLGTLPLNIIYIQLTNIYGSVCILHMHQNPIISVSLFFCVFYLYIFFLPSFLWICLVRPISWNGPTKEKEYIFHRQQQQWHIKYINKWIGGKSTATNTYANKIE